MGFAPGGLKTNAGDTAPIRSPKHANEPLCAAVCDSDLPIWSSRPFVIGAMHLLEAPSEGDLQIGSSSGSKIREGRGRGKGPWVVDDRERILGTWKGHQQLDGAPRYNHRLRLEGMNYNAMQGWM